MKKVISLLLAATMALSSFAVVFAAETSTVTIGSVDATEIADNGSVVVPVTIDKFPEGQLYMVDINFSFDTSKLQYAGYTSAMKVWQTNYDPDEYDGPYLEKATWNANKEAINRDGGGSIIFMDGTKGEASFNSESLAANKILVKLKFTKVAGATGTTEVGINNITLFDNAVNPDGNTYAYVESEDTVGKVNGVPGTITFTAEPTEVIPTATTTGKQNGVKIGDGYTGDTDATDVAAAVGVGVLGDGNVHNELLWEVTADIEGASVTKTHKSTVSVDGDAAYKFGLVIQGLAQSAITAVTAVLQ